MYLRNTINNMGVAGQSHIYAATTPQTTYQTGMNVQSGDLQIVGGDTLQLGVRMNGATNHIDFSNYRTWMEVEIIQ